MHYATCEESDLVLCDGGAVVMRSREFFPRRRFLGTGMCDGIFAESGSAITCAEVTMTIGIQPETTLYRYSQTVLLGSSRREGNVPFERTPALRRAWLAVRGARLLTSSLEPAKGLLCLHDNIPSTPPQADEQHAQCATLLAHDKSSVAFVAKKGDGAVVAGLFGCCVAPGLW